MTYNLISMALCFIAPMVIFRRTKKVSKSGLLGFVKDNKYKIVMYYILVIGFIVRVVNIQNFPNALNVDEASSGYEAYSILNYGIDRNGNSMPVFLLSWGSGQNALLTYMIIPFVKIMGLSVLSTRLPMALIGCISLVVMYELLMMIKDNKFAIIGLAFFAICPWHIIKSRWGLESNVFPDLVLLAVFFIIKSIKENEAYKLYIGSFFLGICAYAYGTSYFFLPFFAIPLLIYLTYKRVITWKNAIISLSIIFVVSLPIILFVIINTFDLPQIQILCFTIPIMTSNRYESLSSIFSGNFVVNSWTNFIESMKILLFQDDGSGWNSISPFGITYLFSLPLTIIGIVENLKKRSIEKNVMNIWFVASFLLLFVCEPNINRINIIMIPIIYYTIIGLNEIIEKIPQTKYFIIIIYGIAFVLFLKTYCSVDFNNYRVFNNDIKEVIEYIENSNADSVYMQYTIKEPYIYTLFYNKTNPHEYINTVKYFEENRTFDNVKSYGKYNFYLPDELVKSDNVLYVISKNNDFGINYEEWKIKTFEEYIVLENK